MRDRETLSITVGHLVRGANRQIVGYFGISLHLLAQPRADQHRSLCSRPDGPGNLILAPAPSGSLSGPQQKARSERDTEPGIGRSSACGVVRLIGPVCSSPRSEMRQPRTGCPRDQEGHP
jgi:hypothetical protein